MKNFFKTVMLVSLLAILQCSNENTSPASNDKNLPFFDELSQNSPYSWEKVARQWEDISISSLGLAEKYESKAESQRFLFYHGEDISYIEAVERYYSFASEEYAKLVRVSDDINSAKSAEMNAKSAEYKALLKKIKWQDTAQEWEKVAQTKPSYRAYAYAKKAECEAKGGISSWKKAEEAWAIVKTDKDLKESFSPVCWEVYQKYAQAHITMYQYFCGEKDWEEVSKSWYVVAQQDVVIVKNKDSWFLGFAKEAFMFSKDKRMIDKIKLGKI